MTPTKESLDRATEWVWSNHRDLIHETWMINSLALWRDRAVIEAKVEYAEAVQAAINAGWSKGAIATNVSGAIQNLRAQLAALNQPRPLRAGEKEKP